MVLELGDQWSCLVCIKYLICPAVVDVLLLSHIEWCMQEDLSLHLESSTTCPILFRSYVKLLLKIQICGWSPQGRKHSVKPHKCSRETKEVGKVKKGHSSSKWITWTNGSRNVVWKFFIVDRASILLLSSTKVQIMPSIHLKSELS